MFPGQQVSGDTFTPNYSWLINTDFFQQKSVQILHTDVDAGSVPTTTLRSGLAMGQVTATKKFKHYDDAAMDGTQTCKGILLHPIRLKDAFGAAAVAPVMGALIIGHARIRAGDCYGLDAAGKVDLKAVGAGFIIEEDFE